MSNRIIINADDYAISPGVSRSIRSLIENERVSATSCMTGSEFWNEDGNALRKIMAPKFSAGLHITLTDQRACLTSETLAPAGKLPSLGGLWRGILAGRIQRRDLELEIYAQIELFKDIMGRAPDHIDGQQHGDAINYSEYGQGRVVRTITGSVEDKMPSSKNTSAETPAPGRLLN